MSYSIRWRSAVAALCAIAALPFLNTASAHAESPSFCELNDGAVIFNGNGVLGSGNRTFAYIYTPANGDAWLCVQVQTPNIDQNIVLHVQARNPNVQVPDVQVVPDITPCTIPIIDVVGTVSISADAGIIVAPTFPSVQKICVSIGGVGQTIVITLNGTPVPASLTVWGNNPNNPVLSI